MNDCKKCNGSGDLFLAMHKDTGKIKKSKYSRLISTSWRILRIVRCDECKGTGVEDGKILCVPMQEV